MSNSQPSRRQPLGAHMPIAGGLHLALAALLQHGRFAQIPKILETPKGDDDRLDRMNLALLRELAKEN